MTARSLDTNDDPDDAQMDVMNDSCGGAVLDSGVGVSPSDGFDPWPLSSTINHSLAFRVGIASAIATIVVIATTFIVDLVRRGRGITSMVWFDLVRTFALWALWLAAAVSITTVETIESCSQKKTGYFTKSSFDPSNTDGSMCLLFRISQVSTWLVTFLIFSWFVVLLAASNIAVARGYQNVWTSPLSLHPIGIGRQPQSDDQMGYVTGSEEKFVPSPYGLLVSSYENRAAWGLKDANPRPPRRDRDEFASTSTLTVQTVHLDPPPPAVINSSAPAVVDLEAQQPQPRRID